MVAGRSRWRSAADLLRHPVIAGLVVLLVAAIAAGIWHLATGDGKPSAVTTSSTAPALTTTTRKKSASTTASSSTTTVARTTVPPPSTTMTPPPTVTDYLDTMHQIPSDTYGWDHWGSITANGTPYLHAIWDNVARCPEAHYVGYDLERGFQTFSATLTLGSDAEPTAIASVQISVDGHDVFSQSIGYGHNYPVRISVAGALDLRIVAKQIQGGSDCSVATVINDVVFGNPTLVGVGAAAESTPTTLN